jgi:hypothetical protein
MTTWAAADPRFQPLLTVARRLGALCEEAVFLGGAVVPLLITDQGAAGIRPTDDVDIAVEVTTKERLLPARQAPPRARFRGG